MLKSRKSTGSRVANKKKKNPPSRYSLRNRSAEEVKRVNDENDWNNIYAPGGVSMYTPERVHIIFSYGKIYTHRGVDP